MSVLVSAQVNFTKSTKEVKLTKEQVLQKNSPSVEKAPVTKGAYSNKMLRSVIWDVQFNYDLTAGGAGQAGIETDGSYIYTTKWSSDSLFRFNMDGTMQDTFFIAGVTGLRDLAFDGTHFYAGSASNLIYQLDFTPGAEALVSTITAPSTVQVRHIAYNSDETAFWVGNWATDMYLVNMSGSVIDTILAADHGLIANYGSAYDNITVGGPYLWILSTSPEGYLYRMRIADADISVIHDINLDVTSEPLTIGGGLFIHPDIVTGTTTLGGLYQGTPNGAFGYDLASCRYAEKDITIDYVYTPNNDAGCSLSAAEKLKVRIINLGEDTVDTNFDIAYTVNGGTIITETVTNTELLPDSTMDYIFTATEDLSADGDYEYTVYTLLTDDEVNANDTNIFSVSSGSETITVEATTDINYAESSWVIINVLTGDTIGTNPWYTGAGTTTTNVCTSDNGCYRFITQDGYGDGGLGAIIYYNGTPVDTIVGTEYTYEAHIDYIGDGCPAADAGIIAILTPNNDTTCVLSATDTITVEIVNYGMDTIFSTLPVAYSIDGGTPVQETITLTSDLGHLDTLQYTFTATVDLSAVADYEVKAYTELASDGSSINDTSITNAFSTSEEIIVATLTGVYPSSLSWLVVNNNTGDTIGTSPVFSTVNDTVYTNICTSDDGCYELILNDIISVGGAIVYYNGDSISTINGGTYTSTASITYFGNGCPADDAGVISILTPSNNSTCTLSATDTITIEIVNYGSNAISGTLPVAYTLDGGSAVQETITLASDLDLLDTLQYTFTATVDLSAVADYEVIAYTELTADEDETNDTSITNVFTTSEEIIVATLTGVYPSSLSWLVVNNNTGDTIGTSPVFSTVNDTVYTNICTSDDGCYELILNDINSLGGAIVYYDGDSISTINGGTYSSTASITYFGNGCPAIDAGVVEISHPNNINSCIFSATDSLTIKIVNFGSDPITGTLDVAYTLDAVEITETITLTSDLNLLDTLEFTFTAPLNLAPIDTFDIVAYTQLTGDEDETNDTTSVNIISTDGQIEVMLYTDTYGGETSWLILNQANDTIAEMSGFTNNSTYSFPVCVDDADCYTFVTNDAYGDGGASVAIYYNGNYVDTIIGTSYTSTDTINFIGSGCPQEGDLVANGLIEYPISPVNLPYQINVEVSNQGNVITEELKVFADVLTEAYTDTVLTPNPFGIGASELLTYTNLYNPATAGVKEVRFEAVYANDLDQSNNIDTINITISDSVLTRDWNDIPTGSIGIGAGETGAFGHPFTILATDTLSSISFLTEEAPINEITSIDVYTFNGTPGSLLASSDEFTFTQSDSAWYTLTIPNGLPLDSGSYFVAINEADASIALATSTNYYTDNTLWYKVGSGVWTDATGSFNHTLFLRLNFGDPVITDINDIENANQFNLYPNPAKDFINIETNSVINKIQIVDLAGKVLIEEENSSSMSITSLSKGIYFAKLYLDNEIIIKKFIKN